MNSTPWDFVVEKLNLGFGDEYKVWYSEGWVKLSSDGFLYSIKELDPFLFSSLTFKWGSKYCAFLCSCRFSCKHPSFKSLIFPTKLFVGSCPYYTTPLLWFWYWSNTLMWGFVKGSWSKTSLIKLNKSRFWLWEEIELKKVWQSCFVIEGSKCLDTIW